jgi:hypothetical protein
VRLKYQCVTTYLEELATLPCISNLWKINTVCVCVYSIMQVYGDDRVPMQQVISELVQPVIGGKVDMAMAEYSDKVYCGCEVFRGSLREW